MHFLIQMIHFNVIQPDESSSSNKQVIQLLRPGDPCSSTSAKVEFSKKMQKLLKCLGFPLNSRPLIWREIKDSHGHCEPLLHEMRRT